MKKQFIPFIAVSILIVIILIFLYADRLIEKYTPTNERKDLSEYFQVTSDMDAAIILNHVLSDEQAKIIDDSLYLDLGMIRQNLNSRFYWDSNEQILRYALEDALISVNADSCDYTIESDSYSWEHPIVKMIADDCYVAIDFVKEYSDFSYERYDAPNRLLLMTAWGDYTVATAKKDTEIRVLGGIKSPILADIAKDTPLTVLAPDENWTKVITSDGIIGYIRSNCLNETSTKTVSSDFIEDSFTHIKRDFKINMAWHQVTNQAANEDIASVLQGTKGVNVISPTWFYLNGNDGSIASVASHDYVTYCHQNNVEVWGLVSNLENQEVSTTTVLTHSSIRDALVDEIVSAAVAYELDGVNVDFEAVDISVGDAYIQFIRELSIKCAQNHLVLSVDNYVPTDYTAFYNRREQGLFADYVIIMGYDEHYAGSDEGSTASIDYVTSGVENTIRDVPEDQVILGMPFYTRVWCKTPHEGETFSSDSSTDSYVNYDLSSYAASMNEVAGLLKANGAESHWRAELGQNYAEYIKDGCFYQIWIEDAASLEEKLKVVSAYELAGGSFWKLGLENPAVWDIITQYIH